MSEKDPLNIKFGEHYIFFSTLPANVISGFDSYITNGLTKQKIESEKTDEALTYIQDFLNTIKAMAEHERKNELIYLQSLTKSKKKYIKNNKFDYITFIKDLNEAKSGMEEFTESLKTANKNLNQLTDFKNNPKLEPISTKIPDIWDMNRKVTANDPRKTITIEINPTIQNYEKYFDMGKVKLSNQILSQLLSDDNIETYNRQISEKINTQMQNLKHNEIFLQEIHPYIANHTPINISKLRGAVLAILRTSLINDELVIDQNKIHDIITKTMDSTLNNLPLNPTQDKQKIKTWENKLYTFLEKSTQYTSKALSDLYDDLIKSFPEKEKQQFLDSELGRKLQEARERIFKGAADNKNKISQAKSKFTSEIKKFVQQEERAIRIKTNKTLSTDEIVKQIGIEKIGIQIDPYLDEIFHINSLNAPTMAEFSGAVKELAIDGINNVYVGGSVVKLRNDFSFTYYLTPLNKNKIMSALNKRQQKLYQKLQTALDNATRTFMEEYKKNSDHSKIDINKAYDSYMDTMKSIFKQARVLLNSIQDKKLKEKIMKDLDVMFSGVSVKEYGLAYNPTKGYHSGTLGAGGGLVINAIPNLINMMDKGGIKVGDAEMIINALLNSFPGSAIGTGHVESITNFLLVGAALMLFDDGFTSGQKFLEEVKKNLTIGNVSFGDKTLHLLYLNNLYYPQSYILQNIYEHLSLIYNQLNSEIQVPEKLLTSMNVNSYLTLNNPLYGDMATEVYNQPGVDNRQDAWDKIKAIAENSVTIKYSFMGGILDIVQSLMQAMGQ